MRPSLSNKPFYCCCYFNTSSNLYWTGTTKHFEGFGKHWNDRQGLRMCSTSLTSQGRNGGTIPRAPNHWWGRWKVPAMSQVLFSIQYIASKYLRFEHGGANLLLDLGAIGPRYAPAHLTFTKITNRIILVEFQAKKKWMQGCQGIEETRGLWGRRLSTVEWALLQHARVGNNEIVNTSVSSAGPQPILALRSARVWPRQRKY